MTRRPALYLVGSGTGQPPHLDDLLQLLRKLTGREPTEQEVAEAHASYDEWYAKHAKTSDSA